MLFVDAPCLGSCGIGNRYESLVPDDVSILRYPPRSTFAKVTERIGGQTSAPAPASVTKHRGNASRGRRSMHRASVRYHYNIRLATRNVR